MPSPRLPQFKTMALSLKVRPGRLLFAIGTSVVFAFPHGLLTSAQTSPSQAPAPWAKTKQTASSMASFRALLPPDKGTLDEGKDTSFQTSSLSTKPVFSANQGNSTNSLDQSSNLPDTNATPVFPPVNDKASSDSGRGTSPGMTNSVSAPIAQNNNTFTQPPRPSPLTRDESRNSSLTPPSDNRAFPPTDSFKTPNPLSPVAQQPVFPAATPGDTQSLPQNPAPNNLNSSGNPLIFPTNPKEVDTTNRQAITLNQAIELALKNNPDVQQARIALEREQANLNSARSALMPTLNTEFLLSRDNSAATEFQNAIAQQNAASTNFRIPPTLQPESTTNAAGTLQLTYNIYTGGERSAQIAKAEKQVRNSQLQVEVTSEQTRFDATDRYYALQGADAQVAIAQASVEDASQSLRDARLLEQAGLGTKFDVLRAEGDLATANEALTRSIADQRNARRKLAQILAVGQKVELTAKDEIVEAGNWMMPLEQTIVQAFKNRAELEQQLIQSEISEQDSLIALSGIQPKVDFLANYSYQDNFNSSVGVVDGYSFGARVRWTFFDGGRAFAEAQKAYRQMDLAQSQFAKQRDQIRYDVEQSYYNLISNKENIGSTRTNVRRFEEALRLARLRFQAGVGTQTDVINAQRDLANARGRFLQAIIGYNQSLNSLQRAVSNLPDNNLFDVRP